MNFPVQYRKLLIEALGNKCEKCGSTKKLIIHHKRYGDDLTLADFAVLCKHCHPHQTRPDELLQPKIVYGVILPTKKGEESIVGFYGSKVLALKEAFTHGADVVPFPVIVQSTLKNGVEAKA